MTAKLSSRIPAARAALTKANQTYTRAYPGEPPRRQPVHTVYGGAQLFKAETARKMGQVALSTLREYAPDAMELAWCLDLPRHQDFAKRVYERVVAKLEREAVEDFRIDFEDGYGHRPDTEEDGHAVSTAEQVAKGMAEGSLPPFIGIRIKSLSEELFERSARTLELFLTTLLERTGGKLPENFVVTLPKITSPEQVSALVRMLEVLEQDRGLPPGALKLELMVETPQSLFDMQGRLALPAIVAAAEGRCVAAHLGVYDYTASLNITAAHQSMTHPACDFARHVAQVSLAGTGVALSDGATNVMPVGPHKKDGTSTLTMEQKKENREVVHRAWRLAYEHTRRSLELGYYQGWDLHPAQLPVRYAAVYAFFLEGMEAASRRLKSFIEKAAQATLLGDVFDDAATGQGLLNSFLRGIACGAITEEEAQAAGLSLEELRSRSFLKILEGRRARGATPGESR
jgi:citrate lyase beta subunit